MLDVPSKGYQPIESYGVIGDLHTVALVGMDGSIDFLAMPNFDSPTIFAALLDQEKGGRFQIAPRLGDARQKQIYLPDANVLLTRFLSQAGVAEISDSMPVEEVEQAHNVIRRVKTVHGDICFRMLCAPRFHYARARHRVEQRAPGDVLFFSAAEDHTVLRLWASVPLRLHNGDAVAEFRLRTDEHASFVLEWIKPGKMPTAITSEYVSRAFKNTVNYWRRWIGQCTYQGRWREMVNRSALTLKLLVSLPHGSLVAAPTFGLPERIGGERNWDYRYTWLRDASFTLYALIRLGYTDEVMAFMKWIEVRCGELAPDGSLQMMYGIDGRHVLTEENLPHLEGYLRSTPVRIGNGAYTQLQLDVYGELMDAVYLYNKYGEPISYDLWMNLTRLLNWLCDHWRCKDYGFWETRGKQHEFLHSRVMCWVALDRGIRLAYKRSLPAPVSRWCKVRDRIYRDIFTHFWDARRQMFVQYKGAHTLDAACLLMPLMRFISPRDPRWLATLRAIEEELVEDSLVYRYKTGDDFSDGLPGEEGTFTMCSFWYVECLARSGDLEKARFFFEKALGYANHLGLYAEELGPRGEHLGNFPQAFTHLALISAAFELNRRLSAAGQHG